MINFLLSLFLLPQVNTPVSSNYDQVVQALRTIANDHGDNAQLFELAVSDSGQSIYGLKIGNGETADLIVATHHGNEYGSTAVAVGAAQAFAANPIAGHTVYVIPVLNIGGYNQRNRYESVNGRSFDPNRDYPGPCGTSGPYNLKSTKALADFIDQKRIVSSATLHTYWPAVLYPWGISTRDLKTEYESTFIGLAKDATVESKYASGNSTELLYAADGAFEDYAYWKHGIWSLLFEMGVSHSPGQDQMKQMVAVNVPGLRRFIENAPKERAANHAFTGTCDRSVQQRYILE